MFEDHFLQPWESRGLGEAQGVGQARALVIVRCGKEKGPGRERATEEPVLKCPACRFRVGREMKVEIT